MCNPIYAEDVNPIAPTRLRRVSLCATITEVLAPPGARVRNRCLDNPRQHGVISFTYLSLPSFLQGGPHECQRRQRSGLATDRNMARSVRRGGQRVVSRPRVFRSPRSAAGLRWRPSGPNGEASHTRNVPCSFGFRIKGCSQRRLDQRRVGGFRPQDSLRDRGLHVFVETFPPPLSGAISYV